MMSALVLRRRFPFCRKNIPYGCEGPTCEHERFSFVFFVVVLFVCGVVLVLFFVFSDDKIAYSLYSDRR